MVVLVPCRSTYVGAGWQSPHHLGARGLLFATVTIATSVGLGPHASTKSDETTPPVAISETEVDILQPPTGRDCWAGSSVHVRASVIEPKAIFAPVWV